MSEHTLTVDQTERYFDPEEDAFTWFAYGTADDGAGLMGEGATEDAAITDLYANLGIAFMPAVEYEVPEMTGFVFVPNMGDGLLGGSHDLIA